MCKFMTFFYLNLSNKKRKISSRKSEISIGSFTQISHILIVTNNHLFLLAFWNMKAFMCIPFYRSLCHSFNFVNMRFVVKVIFFPIKFMESLLQNFIISSFTLTYVPLDYLHAWMNKFLFTENNFLPLLIKQESYSSPHCIFQNSLCIAYV